ncbi:type I DNA topoisomerase [Singulisphaera sp. Ch08]|uniref:DNA topoisomerase 1 n=1 Tax=Singulisphaera sp. Ch08 TaxID=3120278 RepID=A0AAU7CQE3_9BACT
MARKSAKSSPESTPKTPAKRASSADTKTAKTAKAETKSAKSPAKSSAKTTKKTTTPQRRATSEGGSGRSLVIVESPKKAKSINKFLGTAYVVKASMGHVRDLPERKLGLDVEHGYLPSYEIMKGKKDTVGELKREAAKADMVYLATDPDREGEAIAWHLQQALDLPDERVRRVMFHEITERAVKEAFQHVGPINMEMVNAQQARRFLDRFVGYQLSPLLWSKVARHLSAGRVQSVAVRLIADREKEIRAFVTEEYWKITATVSPEGAKAESDRFEALLTEWQGAKFEAGNETDATAIRDALAEAPFKVASIEEVEKLDKADAPFKTSTLQQQGAIRLRFSGKRTMKVAQELYEGIDVGTDGPVGLITYMRTDSLSVSKEAIENVRELIKTDYGDRYLPAKPHRYAAGKSAQEAHEAIRPTDLSLSPDKIKGKLSIDQFKLYQLIYRRFVASQMTAAVFAVTNVSIAAGEGLFKSQGKILKFDGYRRVLSPAGKQEDSLLPPLAADQALDLLSLDPTQHFTQPPPRFTEATLIKALEKENIGRPSTYAPIIQTIQTRLYVEQKERRFFATDLGMIVTDLLVEHFPKIMDLKFTAKMEDELDEIASAKEEMVKVLDDFYHPFQDALKVAEKQMQKVQVPSSEVCHVCGAPMVVKFSKTGQFLGCSKYPECKSTRPMDGSARPAAVETEHICTKCGKPLMLRESKRGQFLSCSGYPACKESFNLNEQGQPVPSVVETEHVCEKCGKPMALRQGSRGNFLGCTGYPKCRNTLPVDDQGQPVTPVKVEVKCEKCGGPMGVKRGKRGAFLGCLNYPKCRSTQPVPEELKEQIGEGPGAAASAGKDDLKSIVCDETCENCGGAMTVREGRRGYFLGCANFPKCKGTKEPGEATLEKITAVTGR